MSYKAEICQGDKAYKVPVDNCLLIPAYWQLPVDNFQLISGNISIYTDNLEQVEA